MRERVCGIYKITSPSKKVYIGLSVNILKRKNYYKNGECKSQPKIYNSIKKYGWDKHTFEILQICDKSELSKLEIYYAYLFNSYHTEFGLNVRQCGGHNGGHSEETKAKMSEKAMGVNNHMYGKKRSPETILKSTIANKGQKRSPSFCKQLSDRMKGEKNHFYGKTLSEAHKKKLSEASTGQKHSEEIKAKISRNLLGKNSKILLNTNTGIFYFGVKEAAGSIGMRKGLLYRKMIGERKNNTAFIYV